MKTNLIKKIKVELEKQRNDRLIAAGNLGNLKNNINQEIDNAMPDEFMTVKELKNQLFFLQNR